MDTAIFVAFQQLPVSHAYGAAGEAALIAVVGIVPVQGFAVEVLAALEQWYQRTAVLVLIGSRRQTGHGQHGRVKVHADDRHVAGGVGLCHTGPADQVRFADSAFVQPAFAAAQRQIRRGRAFTCGQAAIV